MLEFAKDQLMRRLLIVPIIHSQTDLGSLTETVKRDEGACFRYRESSLDQTNNPRVLGITEVSFTSDGIAFSEVVDLPRRFASG